MKKSHSQSGNPIAYYVPHAVLVPAVLSAIAIWIGLVNSPWALLAIPFILLGSLCAAPNMNLVDGFLALFCMVVGWIVGHYSQAAGSAIFIGSLAGWFLSSFEKRFRAIPVQENEDVLPDNPRGH